MSTESTPFISWEIELLNHVGPIQLDQPVDPVLKLLPEPDSISSNEWGRFPGQKCKDYSWYYLPFSLSIDVDISGIVRRVYLGFRFTPPGPRDFTMMLLETDLAYGFATDIFDKAKRLGYIEHYDSNGFQAQDLGLEVRYRSYSLAYNPRKPKGWDDEIDPFIETISIESPSMVAFRKKLEESEKKEKRKARNTTTTPEHIAHTLPKYWKIIPTKSAGPIQFDMTREQVRAVMPPAPITDDLPADYDFRMVKDLAIGGDRWIETITLADGLQKKFEVMCRYTKDTLIFHHIEFRFDIDFFETVNLDLLGTNLTELNLAQTYEHLSACGGSPDAGSHTLTDSTFLIAFFGGRPENALHRRYGGREGSRRGDDFSGVVRFYSGLYAHFFTM